MLDTFYAFAIRHARCWRRVYAVDMMRSADAYALRRCYGCHAVDAYFSALLRLLRYAR